MRIALVVADSLRADRCSGHTGAHHTASTPTLDRLAAQGVSFRDAFSCAAWTVPAMASLVTSVYPHRLGLYRWDQPLPPGFPTLFGLFAARSYAVRSFVFDPAYLYCNVPEAGVVGSSQDLDAVVDWTAACRAENLLLIVHYWGTHFPYLDRPMTTAAWNSVSQRVLRAMNEDPAGVRPKVRGLYDRAVTRFSERFVPRLLEALKAHGGSDGWALVITGDHGETWGEETRSSQSLSDVFDMHGNHLRDDALRIPLLVSGPRWLKPSTPRGLVSLVDIAPTLAEMANLGDGFETVGSNAADGVSLLGSLARGEDATRGDVFACRSKDFVTTPSAPSSVEDLWVEIALRTETRKLLWSPTAHRGIEYDLRVDPREERPKSAFEVERSPDWKKLKSEWKRAVCAPPPDPVAQRLRSLGYLDG